MHTLILLCAATMPAAEPDRWPGFLGAGATPLDAATLPLKWSPETNVAWKTALPGRGQSSPIIWGTQVFVTAIDGPMKDTCQVLALNLNDGSIAWKQAFGATQKVRSNYFQSRAAPTPVADTASVYAFFETGDVVALSHAGKELWRRALTKDYGEFESTIGLAASPLLTADAVILLIDHEGPSYVLALDKKTGKTLWKTERTSRVSYASPALVPVGKTQHLVCSSAGSVDGYDPATGKLLWTLGDLGGNTTATPLSFGPGRFLVGSGPGMHNEREDAARQSNLAISLEPDGDRLVPKVSWRTTEAMPSFASPMVYRDHAYWINKVGIVYCYDIAGGKRRYAERTKQVCWAAPVGVGNRLYCFGKDGLTTVLAAGPEFRILAENQLWDPKKAGQDRLGMPKDGDHGAPTPGQRPKVDGDKPTPKGGGRPETGPGGLQFADPIQYGVAVVNGSLIIRSGAMVYCVREQR